MRKLRGSGLALALIIYPNAAHAADWIQFATSGKEILFADATSITAPEDGITKVWVKIDSSKDDRIDASLILQRWEFKCAAHSTRVSSSVAYKADGSVIRSNVTPYAPFEDIVPDSLSQSLEQLICSKVSN